MPNLRKPSLRSILNLCNNNRLFSVGNRRLRLPEPLPPYEGIYDVHIFGPSCPQQRLVIPQGLNAQLQRAVRNIVGMLYEDVTVDNEDCKSSSLLYVLR